MDRGLRLVKAQVAAQEHECSECPEPIEKGERYMRAAIPGDASIFPNPLEVGQDNAWKYVDREWTIEKTHELCYTQRYYKPVAKGKYAAVTSRDPLPSPNYGGRGA